MVSLASCDVHAFVSHCSKSPRHLILNGSAYSCALHLLAGIDVTQTGSTPPQRIAPVGELSPGASSILHHSSRCIPHSRFGDCAMDHDRIVRCVDAEDLVDPVGQFVNEKLQRIDIGG